MFNCIVNWKLFIEIDLLFILINKLCLYICKQRLVFILSEKLIGDSSDCFNFNFDIDFQNTMTF